MTDFMQVVLESNKLPVAKRQEQYQAVLTRQSQYFAALDVVHKHFWAMLRDGSLRCIGFEAPRTFSAQPVEVPIKFLEYYPDWEKGSYKHSGLHLIELRVFEVARARPEAITELPPPVGRPSFKADILEAFAALQAEGMFVENPSHMALSESGHGSRPTDPPPVLHKGCLAMTRSAMPSNPCLERASEKKSKNYKFGASL